MANIKLYGNTWDSSNIYDEVEGKNQDLINYNTNALRREVTGKTSIAYSTTKGVLITFADGTEFPGADYESTDFVPVSEGDVIFYSGVLGGNGTASIPFAAVAGYDANHSFVVGLLSINIVTGVSGGRALIENYELTIPSGVAYIRASSAYKKASWFNYSSRVILEKKVGDSMVDAAKDSAENLPYIKSANEKFAKVLGVNDYVFCGRVQAGSSAGIDDPTSGNRLRIYYGILKKGTIIKAKSDFGVGAFLGLWRSPVSAIVSSVDTALQKSGSGYSHNLFEMTANQDSYCTISVNKSDGSVFTDSDVTEALNSLYVEIKVPVSEDNAIIDIKKSLEENKYQELYLGELVNAQITANGLNYNSTFKDYRLSSLNVVAFPHKVNKIKVVMNDNYAIGIRTGAKADNLNSNLYWFVNGETVTIPEGHNYYAISLSVNDLTQTCATISMSPDMLPQIGLKLLVEDYRMDHDDEAEKLVNASRLSFDSSSPNSILTYPIIAHASDCHGDYTRVQNFMNFCDRVGVDVAAITGDIVGFDPNQGLSWFKTIVNNATTLCAVCPGNHDVNNSSMTDADAYELVFDGIEEKIGNETGKTWYYKDIAAKNIRIISINLYEFGGSTRSTTHFTSDQINWLCSTLASTPENYGIVLLYHSPQIALANAKSETYSKFFQNIRKYNSTYSEVTGSPINDIIDAFIERTTISKTYAQTGEPSSVSVSADFTNVPSSVDFIAHLTGHYHQDSVCYVPNTTQLQLMLNVVCTNSLYGSTTYPYLCDISDLPRNPADITQNCFNVYVIDRANGTVKITRIGSSKTYDMTTRDYMEIPYKN